MDWNLGYSARYSLMRIDPRTWRDVEPLDFSDGSVQRQDSELLQSARITMRNKLERVETWIRIYLEARQEGSSERVAIFTGLTSTPTRTLDGMRGTYDVECYSVLKPASDILLRRGYYVPAGVNGAMWAKRLLDVGFAPVSYQTEGYGQKEVELTNAILAEDGETNLSMAQAVLAAIDWRIVIDGRGEIYICPYDNTPKATFDAINNDVLEQKVTDEQNWFDCPNVFMASVDGIDVIAKDEDPDSRLSITNRGREVWAYESNVNLSTEITISDYAQNMLRYYQSPARSIQYERRYIPDIYPTDVIRVNYPGVNLTGLFRIESQDINLGFAGKTTEKGTEI